MALRGKDPIKPALPSKLLRQLGLDGGSSSGSSYPRGGQRQTSRRERPKHEKGQKRQIIFHLRNVRGTPLGKPKNSIARKNLVSASQNYPRIVAKVPSKASTQKTVHFQDESGLSNEYQEKNEDGVLYSGQNDSGGLSEDAGDESKDPQRARCTVSQATREALARDDAEISRLEKKLGIKNRTSLRKLRDKDVLGLVRKLDHDREKDGGNLSAQCKRKAEADEWLAHKRRKSLQQRTQQCKADGMGVEIQDGRDGLSDNERSFDAEYEGYFDGLDDAYNDRGHRFDSDISEAVEGGQPDRKRENPYVAPTTVTASAQKYIPPARRQDSGSDAKLLSRIGRQTRGLINRLTESNMLALLGDIEKLYRDYPRHHVTSVLIDLVLIQICEPTSLPDTLLILNAGFATAVYQIIGPDFGAQLLQQTVERFKNYHQQSSTNDNQNVPKYTSNLITFLSGMYIFQLIGCNVIFDSVKLMLGNLSELNTELLLRVVRMAGQNLRRDDPLALKDIVALIGPAVQNYGYGNLSVRAKLMIETINDLKNNKVRSGVSASGLVHDHIIRMKKLLGSLNTRKLRATEPLRIGIKDIEDSDKTGKWWLAGASWTGRNGVPGTGGKDSRMSKQEGEAVMGSSDSDGEVVPNLAAIAREQNMNTDVRRSIFIAIMSASDYEDAYARLMRLHLNKDQQKEIVLVVMQCAGVEKHYNPYYALLARRVCSDRRIRFAFQDSLWKFFRRLGEATFGEDVDDVNEDEDGSIDVHRILALAKMFGHLMAHRALGLNVLKSVNLAYVRPKTQDFLEVLFVTLFLELAGNDTKDQGVHEIFGDVADMPALAKGLQYFLKKRVRKSDLVGRTKDAKKVKKGCDMAMEALSAAREKPDAVQDLDDVEM